MQALFRQKISISDVSAAAKGSSGDTSLPARQLVVSYLQTNIFLDTPSRRIYVDVAMAYRALLKPTADATSWLSSTVLHPIYFPYPLTLVLHAVRISHAYSTKVKASGHKLHPFQHLAGFLVMVRRCRSPELSALS